MSKQKIALGRGFDSLIPTDMNVSDVARPQEQVRKIELTHILQNPDQPRQVFDEKALSELAESIKQHGVIQPIIVTPVGSQYRIVAGERRYRASLLAGKQDIPAVVRNHEELEELEIALVENLQREDLSPLDQAVSIVRLHEQFSLSYKQIAKKLGKAETTISNIVRLLQLPEEARIALRNKQITEGHARAILALKGDERGQKKLLHDIKLKQLSVREAEHLVQQNKQVVSKNRPTKVAIPAEQQQRVQNLFNSKHATVRIKTTQKSIQVVLTVKDTASLDKLLDTLEK